MLILSRKERQTIKISGGITIHVLAADRGRARIGIDAPSNVAVMRSELVYPPQEPGDDEAEDEEVEADMGGEA